MPLDPVQSSDYRSGGYLIARIAERAAGRSADLLPERLLSASTCICPRVPDSWALRWVNITDDERLGAASAFGIGPDRLPEVLDWVTEAMDSGAFGWPDVFLSLTTARAFVHDCLPSVEGLALLGLGLPADYVATFLREGAPGGPAARVWGHTGANPGTPAVYAAVREGATLASGGAAVGFDLLGYNGLAGFHSWLCNGLEQLVYQELHIHPNEVGLLSTLEEAQQALASISSDGVGKEPGVWLPWLAMRYAVP